MGIGPIMNGRQQPVTPRKGKACCDTVNTEPLPKQPTCGVLALGTCAADGSGFIPHEQPIERQVADGPTGSYLWLGDFRL